MKWLVAIGALFCLFMSAGEAFVAVGPIVGLSSNRAAAARSKVVDGRRRMEARSGLKMVRAWDSNEKHVLLVVPVTVDVGSLWGQYLFAQAGYVDTVNTGCNV